MKKMNNKGFSMVELIIVIAIMAILAGALAPTLIKYVNKSRKSSDVSNAQTIASSIQQALSNQAANDAFASRFSNSTTGNTPITLSTLSGGTDDFSAELKSIINNIPKPKYTKDLADKNDYYVTVVSDGTNADKVVVYVKTTASTPMRELYPNVPDDYE